MKKLKGMIGGHDPKNFYFYNRFHYGDHILNLKFFYVNAKLLKERNIQIHYYYDSNYIKDRTELERYIDPTVVYLYPLSEKPDSAIELWMGIPIHDINVSEMERYFNEFYKNILNHIGLSNIPVDTSLYQKEDYLLDLYNKLDSKFQNIDVLLFNNEPSSGQFDFDKIKMDALAHRLLSKKLKMVVLRPVDNIPSTNTAGLSLQDIGAISTHAKYIIGVHTGAIAPCFNIYTKKYVKKWILFDNFNIRFKEVDSITLVKKENVNTANTYIE